MVKVIVVDDEPLVRAGVRAILASDPRVEVIAEAGDGRQAVEAVRRHRPSVVLMDIRMPLLDGIEATREIRRAVPGTGVLILTTFSDEEYIAGALQVGASGFLLKSGDPQEMLAAVHAVAGGAAYLSPSVAKWVISEFSAGQPGTRASRAQAARARIQGLTEREREVLALIGAGLSNADIAARLHLVEGTVKVYASAVLAQLGVRNRVQAAIIAQQAELVTDELP